MVIGQDWIDQPLAVRSRLHTTGERLSPIGRIEARRSFAKGPAIVPAALHNVDFFHDGVPHIARQQGVFAAGVEGKTIRVAKTIRENFWLPASTDERIVGWKTIWIAVIHVNTQNL